MREIRPSGSEGGAVMSRPYPYRAQPWRRNRSVEVIIKEADLPLEVVILVIGGMAMPKPWGIRYRVRRKDRARGQGGSGRHAPYRDYIEAHNHAVDTSGKP